MQNSDSEIELTRLRNKLTKRFHKACADYGLIADGDHILIGVSGGKDSLALVELLGKRAQIYVPRFQVTAVYIRMKERSYQSDIAYLSRFCASVHVPFIVRDAETGEDAKREAGGVDKREKDPCFLCSWYRRKALFEYAKKNGFKRIALGHHKDDIIATLIMNMAFQGSFSSMPPLMQMSKFDIAIIRPLALIEEQFIKELAVSEGYVIQKKSCPYEKSSFRSDAEKIIADLEKLNPNVKSSIWKSMENIMPDYLPKKVVNAPLEKDNS